MNGYSTLRSLTLSLEQTTGVSILRKKDETSHTHYDAAVFSFGDETGYGFHADFLNGWDVDVLQAAIDQCTGDLFQNIEGCPPFVQYIDRERAKSCTIPRVVEEEIDGPLSALPGCNPIPFDGIQPCSSTPSISGFTGAVSATATSMSTSEVTSGTSSSATTTFTMSSYSASEVVSSAMTSSSVSMMASASTSEVITYASPTTWLSAYVSDPSPSASPTGTCKKKQKKRHTFDSRAPNGHHRRQAHAVSY